MGKTLGASLGTLWNTKFNKNFKPHYSPPPLPPNKQKEQAGRKEIYILMWERKTPVDSIYSSGKRTGMMEVPLTIKKLEFLSLSFPSLAPSLEGKERKTGR
jgi:hypothetical protein